MARRSYNGFSAVYRSAQGAKVSAAWRSGEAVKPTRCDVCGVTAAEGWPVGGHNEDYHHPFGYVGVCYPCHMAVHRRFQNLPAWHAWRALTAGGWRPPSTNHYGRFMQSFNTVRKLHVPDDPPPEMRGWAYTLLDEEPDLFGDGNVRAPQLALDLEL